MIWLTWRQFRAQTVVAAGALAVLAVAFAVTGPQLVHLYDTTVATCQAQHDCQIADQCVRVPGQRPAEPHPASSMLVVPALIGIFWGAPLIARELETGTHRLAWTQSVTRGRWLAVKLGLAGLASVATAGLLSLMVTWWSSPFDRVGVDRLDPSMFGQRGIAPVGYAAFAFALGVTAGVLIRRTVPAMAVTLAVFAAVQAAFELRIRFHLITPASPHVSAQHGLGDALGTGGPATGSLFVGIEPEPARRLDHSSQVTTRGRAARRSARCPRPAARTRPTTTCVAAISPDAPAAGGDLPARQPVLGLPVVRDRDLPGPRAGPGRVLHLVGPPPRLLTSPGSIVSGHGRAGQADRRRAGQRRPGHVRGGRRPGGAVRARGQAAGRPAARLRRHHRVLRPGRSLGPGLDHRGLRGAVLPRPDVARARSPRRSASTRRSSRPAR